MFTIDDLTTRSRTSPYRTPSHLHTWTIPIANCRTSSSQFNKYWIYRRCVIIELSSFTRTITCCRKSHHQKPDLTWSVRCNRLISISPSSKSSTIMTNVACLITSNVNHALRRLPPSSYMRDTNEISLRLLAENRTIDHVANCSYCWTHQHV